MLTTVAVSTAERAGGALLPNSLAAALAALRADGIVNLGAAIDPAAVDELREAMLEDMRAEDQPEQLRRLASGLPAGSGAPMSDDAKPFSFNGWGSLRPPPQHPHLHADIVYNPMGVAVSCEYLGDASNPTLTTYGANSAYPGNGEPQNTHRDVPNGREHVDATGYACPGVVINVPLQDFTLENGATQVFLGTHLVPGEAGEVGHGRAARTANCNTNADFFPEYLLLNAEMMESFLESDFLLKNGRCFCKLRCRRSQRRPAGTRLAPRTQRDAEYLHSDTDYDCDGAYCCELPWRRRVALQRLYRELSATL